MLLQPLQHDMTSLRDVTHCVRAWLRAGDVVDYSLKSRGGGVTDVMLRDLAMLKYLSMLPAFLFSSSVNHRRGSRGGGQKGPCAQSDVWPPLAPNEIIVVVECNSTSGVKIR